MGSNQEVRWIIININGSNPCSVVVRVNGSRDGKGVREGLSLRFSIFPTEVSHTENRAVLYCSIFPKSLEGLRETLNRWNINNIRDNLRKLKKDLKDADEIAEEFYNNIGNQEELERAIAVFAQDHDIKVSEEDLAKRWIRMRLNDSSEKIPTIPLRNENEPQIHGKHIRLGIEESEV